MNGEWDRDMDRDMASLVDTDRARSSNMDR